MALQQACKNSDIFHREQAQAMHAPVFGISSANSTVSDVTMLTTNFFASASVGPQPIISVRFPSRQISLNGDDRPKKNSLTFLKVEAHNANKRELVRTITQIADRPHNDAHHRATSVVPMNGAA